MSVEERKRLVRTFDERHGEAGEVVGFFFFFFPTLKYVQQIIQYMDHVSAPIHNLKVDDCTSVYFPQIVTVLIVIMFTVGRYGG